VSTLVQGSAVQGSVMKHRCKSSA